MDKPKSNLVLLALAITVGLSITTSVNAAKKGPRASVQATTVCELDGTDLNITVNVTNKTSGDAVAVIDEYSVTPTYKSLDKKGNVMTAIDGLGDSSGTDIVVNNGVSITHSYQLCSYLLSLPTDLRALNAEASVSYGKDDGQGGVADVRTIVNSCSDDPATEEIEPAGIKISYDELVAACFAP